jgi:hypothetical protein
MFRNGDRQVAQLSAACLQVVAFREEPGSHCIHGLALVPVNKAMVLDDRIRRNYRHNR